MSHTIKLASFLLIVVSVTACDNDIPCLTKGQQRTSSGCQCPEGTRFVEDRKSHTTECVPEDGGVDIDPVGAVDSSVKDTGTVAPRRDASPLDPEAGSGDAGAGPVDPDASSTDPDGGPGGSSTGDGNASDGNAGNDAGAPVECVPGTEFCDGKDNDCDGTADEDVKTRCWADADGDGYALSAAVPAESCDACGAKQTAQEPVAGKVDCDDASAAKSPGATDICGDSIDNDCDGKPDDDNNNACGGPCTAQLPGKPGDGCNNGQSGACARPGVYECRPDHTMVCTAPMVTPAAAEVCGDVKDNDCKNGVDDGCVKNLCGGWKTLTSALGASCTAMKGACSYPGKYVCAPGSTDATVCGGAPPLESCSTAADDNCDGRANENCCVALPEDCNNRDDDCDGMVDEGLTNACGKACMQAVPAESCATVGVDDNCDGRKDEGCPPPAPVCGDGVIGVGEDCEQGVGGWTARNCASNCRQQVYGNFQTDCTVPADLPGPDFTPRGSCIDLPKFLEGCFAMYGLGCRLLCDSGADCPVGWACSAGTPLGSARSGSCDAP